MIMNNKATRPGSSATDLRECAVCLDDMLKKQPKVLERRHSYCMPCLSMLAVAHGTSGLKVPCPKCKNYTYVNSGKLSDLPDNFLLQEVKAVLDDHTRYYYCFYCNKQDQERRAESLCISCHRYMCGDCLEKHKRAFLKHDVTQIVSEKCKTGQEHCKKHNEGVLYVCLACSPVRLFCDVCIMLDDPCNPNHNLLEYAAALSKEKTNLESKLKQQHKLENIISEVEATLNKELSVFQETVSVFQETIEAVASSITSLIKEAYNMHSLRLKADTVKRLVETAGDLLNSSTSSLDEIIQTEYKVTTALHDFDEEKKKVRTLNLNLDAGAEYRKCLSEIVLTQLLRHKHQLKDQAKLPPHSSTANTFSQNEMLKKLILDTAGTSLVVPSMLKCIFEIEVKATDQRACNNDNWCGENCLGQILTAVRDKLKAEGGDSASAPGSYADGKQTTQYGQSCSDWTAAARGCSSSDDSPGGRQLYQESVLVTSETGEQFTLFYGRHNPLSQFYQASVQIDGVMCNCAEQYVMYQKAALFEDYYMAERIMQTLNPREQERCGDKVKGFHAETWDQYAWVILEKANMEKFSQNQELKRALFDTAGTTLAEASPYDQKWGIGL